MNVTRRAIARYNGFTINGRCCIVAGFVSCLLFGLYDPILTIIAFRHTSLSYRRGLFCRALRDTRGEEMFLEPWINATVDYSGANEYMEAHYGNHPLLKSSWKTTPELPYFDREKSEDDKIIEPIYNGRKLRPMDRQLSNDTLYHTNLLENFGMALVNSHTKVMDWKDRKQIEGIYIEELETILPRLFTSEIEMYCFWNPQLRGETHELSPLHKQENSIPTANVASVVHIDTDVGAYESLDDFLAIVEKNEVKKAERHSSTTFDRKRCENEILQNRKRFAVVNFWRSTNREVPITSSPLAILSTRYERKPDNVVISKESSTPTYTESASSAFSGFPGLRPDMKESKWYSFPNMTGDEVLVFYQYDRLVTQPSDLWHCAISVDKECMKRKASLSKLDSKGDTAPRESFDIRVLVVFDEVVDESKDRFHPNRVRPVLSFEESGCFCDEQAEKRSQ